MTKLEKKQYDILYRKANKDLKCRYGITSDIYKELLSQQQGVCAICSRPETAKQDGKIRSLAADHDHKTGKVRGLLCKACNLAIGLLNDNPSVCTNAASYLMRGK